MLLQFYNTTKRVQEIVDEIARRTLSLPDYIITIHKACIIQKEDMVGSYQTVFRIFLQRFPSFELFVVDHAGEKFKRLQREYRYRTIITKFVN